MAVLNAVTVYWFSQISGYCKNGSNAETCWEKDNGTSNALKLHKMKKKKNTKGQKPTHNMHIVQINLPKSSVHNIQIRVGFGEEEYGKLGLATVILA